MAGSQQTPQGPTLNTFGEMSLPLLVSAPVMPFCQCCWFVLLHLTPTWVGNVALLLLPVTARHLGRHALSCCPQVKPRILKHCIHKRLAARKALPRYSAPTWNAIPMHRLLSTLTTGQPSCCPSSILDTVLSAQAAIEALALMGPARAMSLLNGEVQVIVI